MFINREGRILLVGILIWAGATLALRLAGQYILRPGNLSGAMILFAISFPAMVLLARRVCAAAKLPREQWIHGAFWLALPTLLLDPFSGAFFPWALPNMSPQVAGIFGGWMLWCCAGAFVGAALPAGKDS